MTVRIVPLPCQPDQLRFDVILEQGYAKEMLLDIYELRQYRGASISTIIEQKVLDLLQEMGQNTDTVSIVYL